MKKQQRYTPEFRAEAVKLVTEQGLSQQEAAKRLAVPKGTLVYSELQGKYTNQKRGWKYFRPLSEFSHPFVPTTPWPGG